MGGGVVPGFGLDPLRTREALCVGTVMGRAAVPVVESRLKTSPPAAARRGGGKERRWRRAGRSAVSCPGQKMQKFAGEEGFRGTEGAKPGAKAVLTTSDRFCPRRSADLDGISCLLLRPEPLQILLALLRGLGPPYTVSAPNYAYCTRGR